MVSGFDNNAHKHNTDSVNDAPILLLAPPKILLESPEKLWIESIGADAIVLSCKSGESKLRNHLPKISNNMVLFEDFNNNALVELEAFAIALRVGSNKVLALAEIDLLRAARVMDRLAGGATNHAERTNLYRDKYLMKRRLAEQGIGVRPMATFESSTELQDFINRHDYPVIVKPRDGRGSLGIATLQTSSDLLDYLSNASSTSFQGMMVEKFVDAPMIHVNGMYLDGEPVIITPVAANIGCLEFLDGGSLAVAMLDPESPLYLRVVALTRYIIEQAMPPMRNMLFYLELFVDADDLIVCEIATRLGGNGACQEVTEAFGLNPRHEFLRYHLTGENPWRAQGLLKPQRQVGYIAVPPRAARLAAIPTEAEQKSVLHYNVTGEVGRTYTAMKMTNAEIVCAVIEGRDQADIERNLGQFDQWFREATRWDGEGSRT